jgi:serine/threonine protein kinase
MGKVLQPGDVLDGRYELLVRHAAGGMATVWVARVRGRYGFERIVAVKTILPHLAGEERFRAMFLDEARIASRIRHPNVAHLDDVGEADGVPFMVLEWIEGDPLSRISDQATRDGMSIPLPVLLRVAIDACLGLHAAHELRDASGHLLDVVHRDVSHQNLLVTTEGVTKVIDFGVAKAVDRLVEDTRTGLVKGKLEYAAPEYLQKRIVDRRGDVWAIGVILYHELAGRFPYEAESDYALLHAITSGKPPPPLPPEVPQPVADAVLRALEHDMNRRFATAAELARALEAALPEKAGAAEVAAWCNELLATRIEVRRRHLADALARHGAQPPVPGAEGAGSTSSPLLANPLAALPPEAVPMRPDRADELVAAAGEQTSASSPGAPVSPPKPQLRLRHVAAMFAATSMVLALWGMVAFVVLTSPRLNPASATPARAAP